MTITGTYIKTRLYNEISPEAQRKGCLSTNKKIYRCHIHICTKMLP